MAITIKEIQVSTKVTQQKKEPDLPLSRDLIQQIKNLKIGKMNKESTKAYDVCLILEVGLALNNLEC